MTQDGGWDLQWCLFVRCAYDGEIESSAMLFVALNDGGGEEKMRDRKRR